MDTVGTLYKTPAETRVLTMDWTQHLGTDTLATVAWTVPSGVAKLTEGLVSGNKKAFVKVSGGTAGVDYVLTCTVTTTTSAETLQRSGRLHVRTL
jgi:hypothetical protein